MSVRCLQVEAPARDDPEAEAVEEVGDGGLDGREDLRPERAEDGGGEASPAGWQSQGCEEVLNSSLDLSDAVL